jgi:hypothetical protein
VQRTEVYPRQLSEGVAPVVRGGRTGARRPVSFPGSRPGQSPPCEYEGSGGGTASPLFWGGADRPASSEDRTTASADSTLVEHKTEAIYNLPSHAK